MKTGVRIQRQGKVKEVGPAVVPTDVDRGVCEVRRGRFRGSLSSLFRSLNQTNQRNQIDQTNQMNQISVTHREWGLTPFSFPFLR